AGTSSPPGVPFDSHSPRVLDTEDKMVVGKRGEKGRKRIPPCRHKEYRKEREGKREEKGEEGERKKGRGERKGGRKGRRNRKSGGEEGWSEK
ncbi:hypothetical protein, partial [Escherichia coli]|uniref:hypothetical protein n=1 Tax=Escherichia coli TaxID=562 RepID=UPI001BDC39D5